MSHEKCALFAQFQLGTFISIFIRKMSDIKIVAFEMQQRTINSYSARVYNSSIKKWSTIEIKVRRSAF